MRWFLSVVSMVMVMGVASAQGPTSYSDGLPLLKRRPFKPDPFGHSGCSAPAPTPEALGGYSFPRIVISRGPIYSPYSMIRYAPATPPAEGEALPPPSSPMEPKGSESTVIPVE
ncbi:MAG: hypothetical protein N2039_03740, partial [Gemmataceae bacterium]|nr:hypothetical protein [Gemmataceae bacterium]